MRLVSCFFYVQNSILPKIHTETAHRRSVGPGASTHRDRHFLTPKRERKVQNCRPDLLSNVSLCSGTRAASNVASDASGGDEDDSSWVPIAAGAAGGVVALVLLIVAIWCCWCRPRMRQSTNVVINNKQGTRPLHAHSAHTYVHTPPASPGAFQYHQPGFVPPDYHAHNSQHGSMVSSAPYNSSSAWGSMHAPHAQMQPQQSWQPPTPPGVQYSAPGSPAPPVVMSAQGSGSTVGTAGPAAVATTTASRSPSTTRSSAAARSGGGTWTMQTVPVRGAASGGPVATGAGEGDMDAARERLEVELDELRATKESFLQRYEVRACMQLQHHTLFSCAPSVIRIRRNGSTNTPTRTIL